jgi:hypothetical protein
MLGAKVPDHVRTFEEAVLAGAGLKFPEYGASQFEREQVDGSKLIVMTSEVPCRAKDRVLLFRETRDGVDLIDDFVKPSSVSLGTTVALRNGTIVYGAAKGAKPLVRKPRMPIP